MFSPRHSDYLSRALHACVIFCLLPHPEVKPSPPLLAYPHHLFNCNLFLPSSLRPFTPPLSFRGSRNGLLSFWNQLLKLTISYLLNSLFFYVFLWHRCKLGLSLHLPHLKVRFTKHPCVSLDDLHTLPLMFLCLFQHHQPPSKTAKSQIWTWILMPLWAEQSSGKQIPSCLCLISSCCFYSGSTRLFYPPELLMGKGKRCGVKTEMWKWSACGLASEAHFSFSLG